MKKSFVTLGFLIALTPQFGFPQAWKDTFITLAGFLIVILVLVPRGGHRVRAKKEPASFVENQPEYKSNNEASTNY